ncbi:HAD hydrolase family protein [Olsenella sp. Marseille-P4559]|uniref:HAD hydrolase family protein n=1 Tax=Olsenella sp. Marseille-P4559 TaxID=2364795 RepID=UPI0010316036|nr:HAD hydrolase family protein [Olsenella sp. Marseille-P4559]
MDYEPADEPTLDFLADVAIAKMLYCIPNETDELCAIERDMPADLKAGVSTTFSSGRYLEFNPAGVDKGAGLRKLADYHAQSTNDDGVLKEIYEKIVRPALSD